MEWSRITQSLQGPLKLIFQCFPQSRSFNFQFIMVAGHFCFSCCYIVVSRYGHINYLVNFFHWGRPCLVLAVPKHGLFKSHFLQKSQCKLRQAQSCRFLHGDLALWVFPIKSSDPRTGGGGGMFRRIFSLPSNTDFWSDEMLDFIMIFLVFNFAGIERLPGDCLAAHQQLMSHLTPKFSWDHW